MFGNGSRHLALSKSCSHSFGLWQRTYRRWVVVVVAFHGWFHGLQIRLGFDFDVFLLGRNEPLVLLIGAVGSWLGISFRN
jgi:hypothetical protein